jgi:hypothetical protein
MRNSIPTMPREEFYLLGYNAVKSVECQPTFRRNMSPPSSGIEEYAKQGTDYAALYPRRQNFL